MQQKWEVLQSQIFQFKIEKLFIRLKTGKLLIRLVCPFMTYTTPKAVSLRKAVSYMANKPDSSGTSSISKPLGSRSTLAHVCDDGMNLYKDLLA